MTKYILVSHVSQLCSLELGKLKFEDPARHPTNNLFIKRIGKLLVYLTNQEGNTRPLNNNELHIKVRTFVMPYEIYKAGYKVKETKGL